MSLSLYAAFEPWFNCEVTNRYGGTVAEDNTVNFYFDSAVDEALKEINLATYVITKKDEHERPC